MLLSQLAQRLESFHAEGVMVLHNVLSSETVEECRRYIDKLFGEAQQGLHGDSDGVVPDPGLPQASSVPGALDTNSTPTRLRVLCPTCRLGASPVSRLVYDPSILRVVRCILGRPARGLRRQQVQLFQRGSQQGLHQDTWYGLAGAQPGGMVSVSFTIDDVDGRNGPLLYVPGSHRHWPGRSYAEGGGRAQRLRVPSDEEDAALYQETRELVRSAELVQPQAGDAIFWHELLLHGGAPILDWGRMRRSIVTHYKDWD